LDPVDLLGRGDLGHEDRRRDPERRTGEGDALGVVARTRTDDSPLPLRRRHGVDPVVGAADLEGSDLGQVLALDENVGPVALGETVRALQGCAEDDRREPNRSLFYRLLKVDGLQGKTTVREASDRRLYSEQP